MCASTHGKGASDVGHRYITQERVLLLCRASIFADFASKTDTSFPRVRCSQNGLVADVNSQAILQHTASKVILALRVVSGATRQIDAEEKTSFGTFG